MIELIKEQKEWCEQMNLVNESDFYHTYHYHHLSKRSDEQPILIKYTDGLTSLILPLLLRDIEYSDYKDAISVYGYTGILALHIDESFEQKKFHNELSTFFKEHKIVSVFSRLHPFIDYQDKLYEGIGATVTQGKVVYIDLTEPLEVQRAKFNRRLKTYLNKARKSCTVIKGNVKDHLEVFIRLYHENMKRVGADESYFFDYNYFYNILTSKDYKSELMICVHNETQAIAGGALFISKGTTVHYHLSGLSEDYFELSPIKLIIDEMRIKSTTEGYKYLNLGGGKGSNQDSLFRFKSGFSKSVKEFKIWKHIVDDNVYKMLVKQNLATQSEKDYLDLDYFPAYRSKLEVMS